MRSCQEISGVMRSRGLGEARSPERYGVRKGQGSGVRLGPGPKGQRLRGKAELYQAATFSL